jgi:hypothetical protein
MRRVLLAVVAAVVLLLVGSLMVFAQSGQLRLLQPTVVNVNQAVPVNVTLGGIVGGQQVTLTAPMTMQVALQIRLDGAGAVVAASAVPAQGVAAAQPAASAGTVLNDPRGVTYRVDVSAPFQLTQVASAVNSLDMASIVGEIKNAGSDEMQFVQAIVTFYKDGRIVNVGNGYTMVSKLAAGQSSPFQVVTTLGAADFNAYTVQVQGQKAR